MTSLLKWRFLVYGGRMRRPLIALFILTLAFTGCAAFNRDRNFVRNLNVSDSLQENMRHHEPLTLDDIAELSRKGAPAPFIIHYLRPTYFVYKLSPSDFTRLRTANVSEDVIRYLAATPSLYSPGSLPVWYQDDEAHSSDPYWGYRRY